MSPMIEARDVTYAFGETPALRGASLAVAAGEVVAVMGPSGSGKSTLLHCLAGILRPDSGEVRFDGTRIDTLGEADRSALRRDGHLNLYFHPWEFSARLREPAFGVPGYLTHCSGTNLQRKFIRLLEWLKARGCRFLTTREYLGCDE